MGQGQSLSSLRGADRRAYEVIGEHAKIIDGSTGTKDDPAWVRLVVSNLQTVESIKKMSGDTFDITEEKVDADAAGSKATTLKIVSRNNREGQRNRLKKTFTLQTVRNVLADAITPESLIENDILTDMAVSDAGKKGSVSYRILEALQGPSSDNAVADIYSELTRLHPEQAKFVADVFAHRIREDAGCGAPLWGSVPMINILLRTPALAGLAIVVIDIDKSIKVYAKSRNPEAYIFLLRIPGHFQAVSVNGQTWMKRKDFLESPLGLLLKDMQSTLGEAA